MTKDKIKPITYLKGGKMKSKAIVMMVAVMFLFTGCAGMSKRAKCACVGAAAGAAVGTTAGLIVGHNWHEGASPSQRTPGGIIGGVAGALIGGVTGYLVCKEDPKPVPPPVAAEPKCDKIVINSVQFDFDKAVIKPAFYPVLDEAVSELQKPACVSKSVSIEGHTDSIGPDAYNMKLGAKRAASVKNYLVGKGIAAERLSTQSFGESKPIADNKTKKGRAMNRRVEFNVAQ